MKNLNNLVISGVYNLYIDEEEGPITSLLITSGNGELIFQSQNNLSYFIGVEEATYGSIWYVG